jgi:membrane fusion protein, heavy metal efflux system
VQYAATKPRGGRQYISEVSMRNTKRHPGNVLVPLLLVLLLALLIFVLFFPSIKEWWHSRQEEGGDSESNTIPARLIKDVPNTLELTPGVIETLNVRTVPVQKVQQGQMLELSGSLAPDTDHLVPIRSRFAGEVVDLGEVQKRDPERVESYQPVSTGDKVKKGQLLAVVWCKDLGEKKSELLDAVSLLTLDLDRLERYRKYRGEGIIPEQSMRDAERSVAADRIAIARAELTLRSWRLTDKEIDGIYKEAEKVTDRVKKGEKGFNKEQEATWARVEVRAPFDGSVLERNVAVGAIIDPTTNLFMVGDLTKLSLFAYVYEEDLPVVLKLRGEGEPRPIPWSIRLKSDPQADPLHGYVKEIRPFLDPTMHTALVRGQVNNPTGRMISGQFITASIQLPPPTDEVEVPTDALIEDGHDSIVFVKEVTNDSCFTMRQVQVLRRTRDKIYIQSEPQDAARSRGCQALRPGDMVVVGGALELWAALNDQKAAAAAAKISKQSTDR